MQARDVLDEALKLPVDERTRIVKELIKSLDDDGEDPAEVERAWSVELERRARDAIAGKTTGKDWDAAISQIESKHRPKK